MLLDKKFIEGLFPDINEIKSEELREKTIRAFSLALAKGGWNEENIFLVPVTLNWENCNVNLVEHICDVTAICKENFDYFSKYYERNGIFVDRDIVLCGSLLHDLGKFTEFSLRNGKVEYSDSYELMRHPLSGAILAYEAGLPIEIIHLISVHSFEGDKSYQTPESKFVREIDQFVFKNCVFGLIKK